VITTTAMSSISVKPRLLRRLELIQLN